MAKVIQLQWTPLQIEMAGKLLDGKSFNEVLEGGYAKSTLSKVFNAVKAGQRPPEKKEPRASLSSTFPSRSNQNTN